MEKIEDVPIILRREIEALAVVPFLKAFEKELGEEKMLAITRKVIANQARKSGQELAEHYGGNTPEKLVEALAAFKLEDMAYKEISDKTVRLDVHRCPYVDMYRRLGLSEYGSVLSCERDPSTFKGFNPGILFSRTQTLMDGGCCGDFVFNFTEDHQKEKKMP
ncbi:MAG: L-2-amino-thiazoline-4-carboxylic acid hydrolase [Oscillospiraceae bacterium]